MVFNKETESLKQLNMHSTVSIADETEHNVYYMVKSTFSEWCKASTSHGLPNIARANRNLIRIMWIAFFLSSTCYCAYIIINGFLTYLQYDVVIQMQIIRESPTQFPAVTICNLNPFNRQRVAKFVNSTSMSSNISNFGSTNNFTNSTIIDAGNQMLNEMKDMISGNMSINDADRISFGYDLENDMLISCSYNGIKCDTRNFTSFYNYNFGNCYTFNSGYDQNGTKQDVLYIGNPGTDYGLQLELYAGDSSQQLQFSYRTGMYVLVHNQSDSTYYLDGGMNVATGYETSLLITRAFSSRIESPYSDCIRDDSTYSLNFDNSVYNYMIKILNVTSYSQILCQKMCYQFELKKRCGCSDASLPVLNNTKTCQNINSTCMKDIFSMFQLKNMDNLCSSYCPPECDTIRYTINNYIANYPTNAYAGLLAKQKNFLNKIASGVPSGPNPDFSNIFKNSLVRLTINYQDLEYTLIEEIPALDFQAYLANIGGQLGLFIGISILSLLEILELIIEIGYILYYHKFRSLTNSSKIFAAQVPIKA